MALTDKYILFAIANSCSDIHLTEGRVASYRQHGSLITPDGDIVTREEILSLCNEEQIAKLNQGLDLDFATATADHRQRVNVYHEQERLCVAIRLLNETIPTLEQLGLPEVLKTLAAEPRGLILVTGPTGSGKSTTLAAMIDYIGRSRRCHILTAEDPIEYVYGENPSLIHQREVGRDVTSFADALRSALREDPDVILVGEMRDFETISAAVTAAETGHLVLSTLHTTGAARTVDRIIDVFPPHSQGQIRTQLAGVIKGVITQQLLPLAPTAGKKGRIAATEIMIATDAVCNLIREGKGHQLNTVIQSGAGLGMHTLDGCMARFVKEGKITQETALKHSSNPQELKNLLR